MTSKFLCLLFVFLDVNDSNLECEIKHVLLQFGLGIQIAHL